MFTPPPLSHSSHFQLPLPLLPIQKHVSAPYTCFIDWFQEDVMDPFDTTITGPWIGRWEIVNHNRHTDAFKPG